MSSSSIWLNADFQRSDQEYAKRNAAVKKSSEKYRMAIWQYSANKSKNYWYEFVASESDDVKVSEIRLNLKIALDVGRNWFGKPVIRKWPLKWPKLRVQAIQLHHLHIHQVALG